MGNRAPGPAMGGSKSDSGEFCQSGNTCSKIVLNSAKVIASSTSLCKLGERSSPFLAMQGPMKIIGISPPYILRATRAVAIIGDTIGAR